MGRRQRNAMGCGVIAQGDPGLIAAELEVVGGDLHILLAQVFGKDTADLAITDKAYTPIPGVG